MATKANGRIVTPVSGFQFTVYSIHNNSFNPIPMGEVGFSEVSGLSDETEAIDYKEGNDLYPDKLPGQTKAGELTLSKGVDKSGVLIKWRKMIKERTMLPLADVRADIIIQHWDRQGVPGAGGPLLPNGLIRQWKFPLCWPQSYSTEDLSATKSDILIERLVLCYHGVPEVQFPR